MLHYGFLAIIQAALTPLLIWHLCSFREHFIFDVLVASHLTFVNFLTYIRTLGLVRAVRMLKWWILYDVMKLVASVALPSSFSWLSFLTL